MTALLIGLGYVLFIGMVILAVLFLTRDECRDSPDGQHHFVTERTPTGICGRCEWCHRLTAGIDAFRRQA